MEQWEMKTQVQEVYKDQRGDMFGDWIVGTYTPRIIALKEETKHIIWSTSGLHAREILLFLFSILDH